MSPRQQIDPRERVTMIRKGGMLCGWIGVRRSTVKRFEGVRMYDAGGRYQGTIYGKGAREEALRQIGRGCSNDGA